MLDLTNRMKNISFNILRNTWTSTVFESQLTITVRIQYPMYCTSMCLDESIADLYTSLLGYNNITDFIYIKGPATFRIYYLNLQSTGKSVPGKRLTFVFEVLLVLIFSCILYIKVQHAKRNKYYCRSNY